MPYSFKKLNKASTPTTTVSGVSFYKLSEKPSIDPYLTFSSPNSFTLKTADNTKYWNGTLEYSIDTSNWSVWNGTTTISSSNDGKLYLRGTGNTIITGVYKRFSFTGSNISVAGDIKMLLNYSDISVATMANGCFATLFQLNPNITNVENLVLSFETLTTNCYQGMFNSTSISKPPIMLATELASNCCFGMFYACSKLTEPLLISPAITTLYTYCFQNMYYNCSSLSKLPKIFATTFQASCCNSMFSGCSSIRISTTSNSTYANEYRLPFSGTGTAANSFTYMFQSTGGTFRGAPTVNTTYYTSNEVV